ncbi:MAG: hypothetical protein ACRCVI_01495 [Mycoplasmoidaceae bacterium]
MRKEKLSKRKSEKYQKANLDTRALPPLNGYEEDLSYQQEYPNQNVASEYLEQPAFENESQNFSPGSPPKIDRDLSAIKIKQGIFKFHGRAKIIIMILSSILFLSLAATIAVPIVFTYYNPIYLNQLKTTITKFDKKTKMIELELKIKNLHTFNEIDNLINIINRDPKDSWDNYFNFFNKNNESVTGVIKEVKGEFVIDYSGLKVSTDYQLNFIFNSGFTPTPEVEKSLIILQKFVFDELLLNENAGLIFQNGINASGIENSAAALETWISQPSSEQLLASMFSTNDRNLTLEFKGEVTKVNSGKPNEYTVILDFRISDQCIFKTKPITRYSFGPVTIKIPSIK